MAVPLGNLIMETKNNNDNAVISLKLEGVILSNPFIDPLTLLS